MQNSAGGDPADQPRADGRCRLGHRHRQHEEQQRRGRPGRSLRRDDPGEEHGETRPPPWPRRPPPCAVEATVPTAMKHGPDHEEAHVGDQSGPGAAGEVHQEQEGEGTEGAEEAGLRVGEEEVGQAEHQGHDDGGADRPLDGQETRVLGPDPMENSRPPTAAVGHRDGLDHQTRPC